MLCTGLSFDRCIACSTKVIDKYIVEQSSFCLQAFNNPGFLEDLTGTLNPNYDNPHLVFLLLYDHSWLVISLCIRDN